MIVCRECGNHNGDADTFCGSCGSFLEWTGEKTAPKVVAEPEPEPEPAPRQRPGLLQRLAGVIAPAPGGSAVDEGVVRVSDGAGRGVGGGPGLGRPPGLAGGPTGLRPGPPGLGRPGAPPGLRPGPPGAPRPTPPGTTGPAVPRTVPPGTGPRAVPPGTGPRANLPGTGPRANLPGTGPRTVPPGTGPRTVPPGTGPAGPPGTRPPGVAAPPRRLPPPPPGVSNARLPRPVERPAGPRLGVPTTPPAGPVGRGTETSGDDAPAPPRRPAAIAPEGEDPDAPDDGAPGTAASGAPAGPDVATAADAADAPDGDVPAARPRRALAAPHSSPLVATGGDADGPSARTTGGTSTRPRAGGSADAEPEEVTPQPVRPRTTTVGRRAATRRLEPGDLICGECGEGNPPTRRFCSRCGDSLRTAEVVRRRWWQRLLPRRGPKVTEAGTRPGTPGGGSGTGAGGVLQSIYQRANAVAAVVLFALGIAYLIYPPLRERVNAVVLPPVRDARAWVDRKLNPRFVAARPVEVTGSESVPEHGPDLTVDQYRNTHWQVRWDADRPATVTLRFGAEVDLERLIVIAGTAEDYTATHRPAKLHLVWSTNRSDTLTVQDTGEPQTLTLTAAKKVTSVQIQVTDVYRADKGTDVTVSELEFFARE
ncbi:hypothetical protein [Micromonospora sp. NPDC023956]|uniref:zinc ribbon domain-containing protein n=1 Tax=Micromonospora sp. NPDC023956 TaxID=3155722 RepID=UPI0033F0309D